MSRHHSTFPHPLQQCLHCENTLCSNKCPAWLAETARSSQPRLDTSVLRFTPPYSETSIACLVFCLCLQLHMQPLQRNNIATKQVSSYLSHKHWASGFLLVTMAWGEILKVIFELSWLCLSSDYWAFAFQLCGWVFLLQYFHSRTNFMSPRYSMLLYGLHKYLGLVTAVYFLLIWIYVFCISLVAC